MFLADGQECLLAGFTLIEEWYVIPAWLQITKKYVYSQINSGYLNHVIDVLDRVGYTYTTNGDGDWDLLWSHNYPFTDLATQLQKLKPYQKVYGLVEKYFS